MKLSKVSSKVMSVCEGLIIMAEILSPAGFTKAEIKPQLSGLKSSSITVPTILGSITGTFTRNDKGAEFYSFKIPHGMTAELIFPFRPESKVFVNKKRAGRPYNITLIEGLNKIEIR